MVGHRYRFVTLEGDVVNPGGSMTGGASKAKNDFLIIKKSGAGRVKNKLTDMEKKTNQLEKQVRQTKVDISEQEETA